MRSQADINLRAPPVASSTLGTFTVQTPYCKLSESRLEKALFGFAGDIASRFVPNQTLTLWASLCCSLAGSSDHSGSTHESSIPYSGNLPGTSESTPTGPEKPEYTVFDAA